MLGAKSFVGGSAREDTLGHGTFVAGLIAAGVDNGIGIAGLAPSAELLVAKVVTKSRAIPVDAEAKAIRWAVEQRRARDQHEPRRCPRSARSEPRHLLAARGGCGRVRGRRTASSSSRRSGTRTGRREPGKYASYPAALPHVLGVSALDTARRRPDVLEPRSDLQRSRGTRARDPLHPSARADGAVSGLHRAGLLELRLRRVPRGAGDVLRRSPGERRGRRPPQPASDAASRAGDQAPPGDRGRPERLDGCDDLRRRARRVSGWGRLDVAAAIGALAEPAARARLVRVERRRRVARVPRLGLDPAAHGDRRLLGRPGRRLRDPARSGTSRSTSGSPARTRASTSASRFWLPKTRSIEGVSRRPLPRARLGAAGRAPVPLVPRRARPARTTCRCECRARASRRYRLTVVKG